VLPHPHGLRWSAAAWSYCGRTLNGRDHPIGYLIRVLLVRIACFADTTLEVHAPALLHNVRGLVGRGVEIRRRRERNMVAGGECLCADRAGPHGCRRICVRLDISDVVAAK
jgi:hypothetical protein